jgi:hypothetical protein
MSRIIEATLIIYVVLAGSTATAGVTLGPVPLPPVITMSFGEGGLPTGWTTTLTFTITNPNPAITLTGIYFTDSLPFGSSPSGSAGMSVATPANLTTSCPNGTINTSDFASVSLKGLSLEPTAGCTISLLVTAAGPTYAGVSLVNSVTVSDVIAGVGNTAQAYLTALPSFVAPTVRITFGPDVVPLNGTSALNFQVNSESNETVSFIDTLPPGLVVATPNGLNCRPYGCHGNLTAIPGAGTISWDYHTDNESFGFSVNVTATTPGVHINSVGFQQVHFGRPSEVSSATLTAVASPPTPPTLIMAFGAPSIDLYETTSLMFTLTNANETTALTGTAFSDSLPSGLQVVALSGGGTCADGTITAVAGSTVISMSGATLAPNTSCTFTVDVTGVGFGKQDNTTSFVTSTNGGAGTPASASIIVQESSLLFLWFFS